jgi:hypothetical protein
LRVSDESDLAIFSKRKDGKMHDVSVFVVNPMVVVVEELDGVGTGIEIVLFNPGHTVPFIEIQIAIVSSAVF